ncbi:MAG: 30S ribosome-binding factor RbfA [Bacteroidales bacterium]|nr:30S ribosome-binding factor RbfA [Bacteroidales bacterium]MDD5975772.1 30S ribosome-binding factor RbfA [Bacteroidales bacterium]MDY5193952.1 30S ribosome-binding factor RbfA [Candidatus Aphodosoma sp.]
MQSTRQEKISRLLQKEFGDIFVHYGRQIQGVIISVSEVRITSDLSISRIYLSIFPTEKATELIERINADKSSIRYELGRRLRNQLRIIPELNFYLDESIDKLANIDKILGADPYLHVPLDDEEDDAED